MKDADGREHRRIQAIRQHYEPRLNSLTENYAILDWASAQSQQVRFRVLADNVDLAGKSLLDVGCGLGDLWTYLKARKVLVDYTGVDILDKMVQAARQRHPDGKFIAADLFAENRFPPESFDAVFCSGALNLNLGNSAEFLPFAIRRLLQLCRECLVFNLLHKRSAAQEDTYAYSQPSEVLAMLQPMGCQVTILDDYLPNDFTTICRKGAG